MIYLNRVCKTFKVPKRSKGLKESLKALIKREYEEVKALDEITFTINEGEIVGYIGPNGAGKSTTIKIMSGIMYPDSGDCRIMGEIPWKNRINHVKNIGVVFGQRTQLWWDVPVWDSFNLLKDIYKIPDKTYKKNFDCLVELLDLKETIKKPVRQLSLGQKMRCEIVASLLHNPKVLFLDEPTIGLDAVSKVAVRNFIKKLNEEKKITIILTTHDMSDIEALTNKIYLIGHGKILFNGDLNVLRKNFGSNKVITVDYTEYKNEIDIDDFEVLYFKKGKAKYMIDTNEFDTSKAIAELSRKFKFNDVTIENPPIEDLIVNLYKEHNI